MSGPTLSGAETGNCRPLCNVSFWIFKNSKGDDLERLDARMRILSPRTLALCWKIAEQFCEKTNRAGQRAYVERLVRLNAALCTRDSMPGAIKSLFAETTGLLDEKGNVKVTVVAELRVWDLAEAQINELEDRYALLVATETPGEITNEQWEALIAEGKELSLQALVLKHGSSTVTAVVHGTAVDRWRE